jgi:hypothetical protein
MVRRLTAVGALTVAMLAGLPALLAGHRGAPAARADACVQFSAYYYTVGGAKHYVTPWAPGSCLGPPVTGWTPIADPTVDSDQEWLPAPVKGGGFTSSIPSQ